MQNIINNLGQSGNITDVAFLEFDFIPLSSNFSFDFLFASNEYGQWQCASFDTFAFFLTDLTSNTTTLVGSTPELLTNGSFVGNTNVSQYNAAQSFGSNTIITLANPGDSPYVLQQIGSAEYEMQCAEQTLVRFQAGALRHQSDLESHLHTFR